MQNQTTRSKRKKEQRHAGRQEGRQAGRHVRQAGRQRRKGLGKADTPSNTQAHRWGDNGRPRGNKTLARRTPSNTGTHVGRQWETVEEDKGTLEERQWETIIDNGRRGEDLGKADTSNTGTLCAETMGDKGRKELGKADTSQQRETRREMGDNRYKHTCGETMGDKTREGGHAITGLGKARQGETGRTHMWGDNGETRGHKASGKQTHQPTHVGRQWKTRGDHPTQAQTWGDTARQWEARPREGGHTIQHRHACGENGRKGETRPWEGGHANTGTCGDMEDKGRQGGKVDTPSTKGKQKGTHGETRPREGGHTIQHRHTYVETRGDKTSGGYTITTTYVGQDLRKAGTPRQCEAMGDKTSGKTNTPQSLNGRHGET